MKRKNFKFLTLSAAVMTALIFCLTGCKSTTEGIIEEPEVDYVDEDGYIYYKNPTEWTYEMVYEALSIENKKAEAPLTFEDFGEKYSLYEETLTYFEYDKVLEAGFVYNNKKFGSVLLTGCTGINDRNDKEIGFISLMNPTEEWYDDLPDITVNDIGLGATRESVISALGIPYSEIYQDGELDGVLIYKSEPEQKTEL